MVFWWGWGAARERALGRFGSPCCERGWGCICHFLPSVIPAASPSVIPASPFRHSRLARESIRPSLAARRHGGWPALGVWGRSPPRAANGVGLRFPRARERRKRGRGDDGEGVGMAERRRATWSRPDAAQRCGFRRCLLHHSRLPLRHSRFPLRHSRRLPFRHSRLARESIRPPFAARRHGGRPALGGRRWFGSLCCERGWA